MTLNAKPSNVGFKRVRVQARQIYVFSHAYLNGFADGIDVAANGWAFLRKHAWTAEGHWSRILSRRGAVLDPTADLYDHAFVLFGLAWWMRASGEDSCTWADRTLEAIDSHLGRSDGHGWWSENGPHPALVQNPHMHLLEACLAAYFVTGAASFKRCAEKIVDLFNARMFDPATGTVAETFHPDWRRVASPSGSVIEPGHQYEWVWLLCSAAAVIPGADRHADALFTFADRFGSAPNTGLVYDRVLDSGEPLSTGHRLWPNTEALKAHAARAEQGRSVDHRRVAEIIDNLLGRYIGRPTRETWTDQLNSAAEPSVHAIPTSAMYHIHHAITELRRLEEELCTAEVGI